ncbi:MAG: hypothetical protein HY669_01930 [Chloroflexi bacterium]|nr:hypothetical protein [Chloroflexota bacterium]
MRPKETLRKVFSGLLAALLAVSLLASAVLAVPQSAYAPAVERQAAASLTFDALEIFPQEAHELTPRSAGPITNDTTAFDAGLPPGTTALFVIGGTVKEIDAASGQWQIGTQPVFVYESSSTVMEGAPAVGDHVTIVGKRSLSPGPIVAQYITQIDPAPQALEPAVVTTALLFNGTVTATSDTSWTVTPPAPDAAVTFNILADMGPFGVGPTIIEAALGVGSAVTVEYLAVPYSYSHTLAAGWNMMSTPVNLQAGEDTIENIFDAASLANLEIAYGWENGQWVQLTGSYKMQPLDAMYLKVAAGSSAVATMVPSSELSQPPSRDLQAGLNLIGPAPAMQNGQYQAMPLSQALVSIAQAPGGTVGYTMVISPELNQPGWAYALGGQAQDMLPYKGYWVVMENSDTLYGFSTTP